MAGRGSHPLDGKRSFAPVVRQADVGSRFSPEFRDERVPTPAEAFARCKGKVRVENGGARSWVRTGRADPFGRLSRCGDNW